MAQRFWKVVTSTLNYDIPDVIRNSISLSGFDEPLVFKDLNDEDIAKIEKYMREEALDYVASTLSKSFDGTCDALLDDDQLAEIFGERYSKHPEKFKFLPGQIALIKTLVAHVKKLVDEGGLQQFNDKKKKRKKTNLERALSSIPKKRGTSENASSVNPSHSQLSSDLFDKVIVCLKSYGVDVSNLTDSFTKVDPSGKYGEIACILCQDENQKPKRVFFHPRTHSRSSYWVLSKFNKHLEKHHLLVAHRSNKTQIKQQRQHDGSASDLESKAQFDCNYPLVDGRSHQGELKKHKHESNETDKIEVKRESSVEAEQISNATADQLLDVSVAVVGVIAQIDANSLFTQMSEQIQRMVSATLMNGEKQEIMKFHFRKAANTLSVVATEANGDCLFSALAHQLWTNEISSSQHKRRTKGLRKAVVEHILRPENFKQYESILQERITTEEKDAKLFVRHVLVRSGQWGGLETIKAISNEHNVNVVVFNEEGMCNMIQGSNDKQYTRTIMIAYRLGTDANGGLVYNHYDSVTDLSSQCILKAAEFITMK